MNYYPHHIGDYASATMHLSIVEDGAYRRLLDLYYLHEKPLPGDKRQVYRLVRAATKVEQAAVDAVLAEFFVSSPDGYRHRRCDAEIAKVQSKSEKARRSAAQRWHSEGNANADANAPPNAMRTHSEGNAPNNQEPIAKEGGSAPAPATSPPVSPAAAACKAMKSAGLASVNPSDAELLALLNRGVTAEQMGDLTAELRAADPTTSFRYVIRTMAGRLRDAARRPAIGRRAPADDDVFEGAR